MPIYEYQCTACQKVTEAWQGVSEEPLTTCQHCSGTLKKLISMSSFQLKGGGWYADGYSTSKASATCPNSTSCPAKGDSPAASTKDSSTKETKPTACGQGACCGT